MFKQGISSPIAGEILSSTPAVEIGVRTVGLAIHGDRAHAEFTAGVDDPECDFATIGDENFLKH